MFLCLCPQKTRASSSGPLSMCFVSLPCCSSWQPLNDMTSLSPTSSSLFPMMSLLSLTVMLRSNGLNGVMCMI